MSLNRRGFIKTAAGALAYASSFDLLAQAKIDSSKSIKVANLLDKTGVLNNYCLKQIKAVAMAADEINAAGGLLGRKVEIIFYDTQSSNRLYSQYATQAFVRDKVDVIHGAVASSAREVVRPIVQRFKGLYFYNALYEGGVCDRRHVCPGMVPGQELDPLVDYVIKERNAKTHYILAADYNYGQITSKWLQKFIREKGARDVAVEFFPLDVTNFAPALSRIQAARPDAVWSALVGDAHMSFYRQFESTIGKKNMTLIGTVYGAARENAMLSAGERRHHHRRVLHRHAAHGSGKGLRPALRAVHRRIRLHRRVWRVRLSGHDALGRGRAARRQRGTRQGDRGAAGHALRRSRRAVFHRRTGQPHRHGHSYRHRQQGQGLRRRQVVPQRQPSDTQAVCDLRRNPDDTRQYEPKL